MKIVIVGNGKVGRNLTRQLSREGHSVVVIDNNPEIIDNAINAYDVMGICGNGALYDIQKQAGVDKSDLLIAVTQTDELNILCCLLAKKIGVRHSIARVRTPDYSRQLDFMRTGFGISMLINPEYEAANEIARILRFPSAVKVENFANERVEIAEIIVGEENQLIGMPVHIIHEKYSTQVLLCAVRRGDEAIIPNGDFVIKKGDHINVTATRKELLRFIKKLGLYRTPIKRVMIAGGGKVGYYLAKQLIDSSYDVKIIESDPNRALELSLDMPEADIIVGDATQQELLSEQRLSSHDAFVALMGHDEENAIISMYAASQGVSKVITKSNRLSTDVLFNIGLDSVISAKELATDQILRYVRALHNSSGSAVRTLYRIVDGRAEALEFGVPDDFEKLEVKFRELKLKKNLIIACIIRRGKIIYPHGDDCIEKGDSVIVVTTMECLRTLNDILE